MHAISFNDISLKARKHKKHILQKTASVITSGVYLHGKQNALLEKKLSKMLLNQPVVTVASGHDALLLSLLSLHLTPKDEIIFPVNAYPTAFPIMQSGAKPIPVDVDEDGQLSLPEVKKKITKHTKVIILVHMYGMTTDITAFGQLAKVHDLILLEDCAQAFGTLFNKKPVGTFGDIGCFSFYPTKNLGTLGDGGAITTSEKKLYQHIRKARSYGENIRYNSHFISGHSRLAELQAGILSVYLTSDTAERKKRNQIHKYYLAKLSTISSILPLQSHRASHPAIHLLVIRAKKRDMLMSFLQKKKIPVLIHYPTPIHKVPAFTSLGYKKGDFPKAETLAKEIISLPFHSHLSKSQINYIIKNITAFYSTS